MSATTAPALERHPVYGPALTLRGAGGAQAVVTAHGAHVVHWRTADGREPLYLSHRAVFEGHSPIRGGMPVIFPQFADQGPLPKHGFARNRDWQLESVVADDGHGKVRAVFVLRDDQASRATWPHPFEAKVAIELGGAALAATLSVHNTGNAPFDFTAAFHSYLQVRDLDGVGVFGLQGLTYRDTAAGGREVVERRDRLGIVGEVDRIYLGAPAELRLEEPTQRLRIQADGFVDAVVWNPGADKAAAFADLDADGYKRFVCIESAVIGRPVQLAAGAAWHGTQTLVAG